MIYVDSCYLAKLYLYETNSPQVRAAVQASSVAVCSVHGMVEVQSVFHRKLREGWVSRHQFRALMEQFALEAPTAKFRWLPLNHQVLEVAQAMISALPATVFLRAADAVHLAAAKQSGFSEIYTSDRHLLAAAPHFGLTGVCF